MAKGLATRFVCQSCGASQAKWSGRCPACGAWNTLLEEEPRPNRLGTAGRALPTAFLNKSPKTSKTSRLKIGIAEVDRVLGGGLVAGSLVLLAGEPGIGKSTLLLEIANEIAKTSRVLYVSGEESLEQIELRAGRLGVTSARLELATSVSADDICASILSRHYTAVIIDSIQTVASANFSSAAGTISQITGSTQLVLGAAKQTGTSVILAGHVTKEGNIAGPKLLEHIVDVVLSLEGERFSHFKLLHSAKNRFGPTYEVGVFEMREAGLVAVENPSKALLSERQTSDGSVVLATLEGSRALLVEVQALVSQSPFGYPKRTAVGFDLNRLNLLLAVLSKRAGLQLGASDVYVNVVGGIRINEPAADLAVAVAIASAARSKPISDRTVVFGEVGLSGEVRSVGQPEKRIAEAQKLGFKQAIAPAQAIRSVFIKPVGSIAQAIKLGLGVK